MGWQPTGGASSPLTTKGDVWGYDSADARIPIGTDGEVLTADSAQSLGLKWGTVSGTITQVVLAGHHFESISGSAASNVVASRQRGLAFDPSSEESAAYTGFSLHGWTAVHIDLLWTIADNASPTGNVVWAAAIESYSETDDLGVSGTFTSDITDAVGAQQELMKVRLESSYSVTASEDLYSCRVVRRAADANDTNGDDAELMAVLLTDAS